MPESLQPWLDVATAVVAESLATGRPPREVLAANHAWSRLPPATRGRAVAAANAAIVWQRRSRCVLQGELPEHLPPSPADARLLVLAAAVIQHQLLPGEAAAAASVRLPVATWAALPTPAAVLQRVADPVLRLALLHSVPDWLAQQFVREFGDGAESLLQALNQPGPRTIRCNPLRIADRATLAARLAVEGIATQPTRHAPHGLQVHGEADLFATAAYAEGCFEQQDEASQLGAWLVAPPPRGRVLDLCAGAGGKTLALAAALANRGTLLATDVASQRLQSLRQRAARAGVNNLRAVAIGERHWPPEVVAFAARADRILLDAPCSGSGSWRRRPEARWRLQPADLAAMQATQDSLLDRAATTLAAGARLIYATCSVFQQENEQRVAAVLQAHPELVLQRPAEVLGHAAAAPLVDATGSFLSLRPDRQGCDGFFAAILRRPRPH